MFLMKVRRLWSRTLLFCDSLAITSTTSLAYRETTVVGVAYMTISTIAWIALLAIGVVLVLACMKKRKMVVGGGVASAAKLESGSAPPKSTPTASKAGLLMFSF